MKAGVPNWDSTAAAVLQPRWASSALPAWQLVFPNRKSSDSKNCPGWGFFFFSVCCSPYWCWGEGVWAMKTLVSLGSHPRGWVGKQLKGRTAIHSLAAGPVDHEEGSQNVFQPLKHHRRRPQCGRAVEGPGWVMAEACLGLVLSAEGCPREGRCGRWTTMSWRHHGCPPHFESRCHWTEAVRKFLRNWGLHFFTLTTPLLSTGHWLWLLVVFMCAGFCNPFRPHQLSLGET